MLPSANFEVTYEKKWAVARNLFVIKTDTNILYTSPHINTQDNIKKTDVEITSN